MRNNIITLLIQFAMKRRMAVLISTILLTLILGGLSGRLQMDMRWSTLLPESLPVVQEFKHIDENFYQPGNMIVAVSGPDPVLLEQVSDEVKAVLERDLVCPPETATADCIEQERYARYVYGKMPENWLTEHALRLAKPNDARRTSDILSDPRLLPYLMRLNDDFEMEYTDSENVKNQENQIVASLDAVQQLVETIADAADGQEIPPEQVNRVVRDLTIGRPYMFSLDNSMSLIMVASAIPMDDAGHLPFLDRRIETLLAPLAEQYPDVKIERTGMTAVGRDEMDSVGPYTMVITLAAFLMIFLLLIWNFRSVLVPVLALVPIVLGIIWTIGIIAITLGEMNLITMMIMAVLLGLGIDFSLHIATRFHEERTAGKSIEDALYCALAETGKGVLTGALTTAAAFYALMIAQTKGISQFGFCSGTGVIVTLVAVFWVLPSLLAFVALRKQKKSGKGRVKAQNSVKAQNFTLLGDVAVGMRRFYIPVILVVLALTIGGIWAGMNLDWEWNFNKLEPAGIRSVTLQDDIIDKFKLSISMSMMTANSIEESRELRDAFKSKGIVGDVDDISLWVSRPDFEESRPHLARLRESVAVERPEISFMDDTVAEDSAAADSGDEFVALPLEDRRAMLADEIDRLWANIVEMQALSFTGGQDRVVEKTTQLVATRETRDSGLLLQIVDRFLEDDNISWDTFDGFAQQFGQALHAQATRMAQGDAAVTEDMIPGDIRSKYISKTGTAGYLLQILPKRNLYEKEDLELFQEVVSKISPNVTGTPQMILNMNLETLKEGKMAALAAIIVILIVLLIDFRKHPLVAGLAFLPLISGTALMLGGMWLLGEKFNYMNMIALPVIIGIGVDDGVHFFHRYIQEGKGGLHRAVTSVGRAMLMTSLTTMIGFGSLMFYLMQGMASFGLALFLGVGMCFIVTITLLPALTAVVEKWIIKK
jgi:predicted RND superfamily exporter protein